MQTQKLTSRKLTLEVSESLLQNLEELADATDQTVESLILGCVRSSLPVIAKQVRELDELLAKVTPENIHEEIDFGGSVGGELW
ncbi:MAG: hypothetical protein SXA11_16110 [Cyanobacteriota bacterium]|nr:hypothetical protein [Cyanobacteriota bacterium]